MWNCIRCETFNDDSENECIVCGCTRTASLNAPRQTAVSAPPPVRHTGQPQTVPAQPYTPVPAASSPYVPPVNDTASGSNEMGGVAEKPKKSAGTIIKIIAAILLLLAISVGAVILVYSAVMSENEQTTAMAGSSAVQTTAYEAAVSQETTAVSGQIKLETEKKEKVTEEKKEEKTEPPKEDNEAEEQQDSVSNEPESVSIMGQINRHGSVVPGYDSSYICGGGDISYVRHDLGDTWHITAKRKYSTKGTVWYELWDSDDGDYYGWVDVGFIDFY